MSESELPSQKAFYKGQNTIHQKNKKEKNDKKLHFCQVVLKIIPQILYQIFK